MSPWLIVLIVLLGVMIAAVIVLKILGDKSSKKQAEQNEEMAKNAMSMSLYIIDKKKLKLKNAGLPKVVMEQANFTSKIFKFPTVKAKVGNKVMTFLCDQEIYKTLLPKQEIKAQVSGLYIIAAKRIRGPILEDKKKKGKDGKVKQSFLDKLR